MEISDYGMYIAILILLFVIVWVFAMYIRIVQQSQAFVIERLGSYQATWHVGLHFLVPFIDRIVNKVSLKELVVNFMPQPVITKDNITMSIDTVLFYQITDPFAYTYGVHNPLLAIENLTTTALRNIIGDLELDETLTSRDIINSKMRSTLDEATHPWGIKVNRVEVKNIVPPKDIQDSMEKQMRAERERREAILKAEGEKKSAILVAEGQKQAMILEAEANKAAQILNAEAAKEAAIKVAQGEAQAILEVQTATAKGIELINNATPSNQALTLKALESFAKIVESEGTTKIIIPSDIQAVAGLATSIKEVIKDNK